MAEVFSTVPVRTDNDGDVVVGIAAGQSVGITGSVAITSSATLDVEVVASLPAGGNTIGNVGIIGTVPISAASPIDVSVVDPLPAGSNVIGSVTISGTPSVSISGTPTVSISGTPNVAITGALPTGTNSIGNVGLNAGTNIIGKVEVVSSAGTIVQEVISTTTDVIKGGATPTTLNSTAIPNGKKGELRQILIAASVAMKFTVRTDNTVTQVNKAVGYIPAGGGTIDLSFMNEAVVLNGTAAGENFDVVLLNLDTKNDAPASVTFVYSLEP